VFEGLVRTQLKLPRGKGAKPVAIDGFVPDLPVGKRFGVTDIKNVKSISQSPQTRAFAKYAKKNNLPFNLIIGPRTRTISGPLLDQIRKRSGVVLQFNPTTNIFKNVKIGATGRWSR